MQPAPSLQQVAQKGIFVAIVNSTGAHMIRMIKTLLKPEGDSAHPAANRSQPVAPFGIHTAASM